MSRRVIFDIEIIRLSGKSPGASYIKACDTASRNKALLFSVISWQENK